MTVQHLESLYPDVAEWTSNCGQLPQATTLPELVWLREVKALGWITSLTYIGIDDPATNIQRVRSRVTLGGHDVPVADIVRRYDRSLANLNKAAKIVDSHSERLCQRLILYDNSTNARYQQRSHSEQKS